MPFLDDLGSSSFPSKAALLGNERIPLYDTYEAGNNPVKYVLASALGGSSDPVDLAGGASSVSGVLPVANGGTGTSNGSITGTTALAFAAGGTNQNLSLAGTGSGVVTSASRVTVTNATSSSSTSTGALVVTGGMGVGGSIYGNYIQSSGNLVLLNSGQLGFGISGPYVTVSGSNEFIFNNAGGAIRAPINVAGFSAAQSTVSSNTTLSAFDHTVLVNTASGNINITLPTASSHPGRKYVIKKTSGDANSVTVVGTIDNATNFVFNTQYRAITVQSNGSSWFIVGQYQP